jgi:V/A-type H+-transporting ATPase subunit F
MTFYCIADAESSLGFRLAGVDTREVSNRAEALEALEASLAIEDIGILLVTVKAASFIRNEIDKVMYKSQHPLILEIPSRGEIKKSRSVGEFLKEIIGVSV